MAPPRRQKPASGGPTAVAAQRLNDLRRNPVNYGPGGGNRRLMVYALGVAAIVGSGTIMGAVLRTDQQEKKEKQVIEKAPEVVDHARSIQDLQTRRAHLLGQKIQLERKIEDLHEDQRKKAAEEAGKKAGDLGS